MLSQLSRLDGLSGATFLAGVPYVTVLLAPLLGYGAGKKSAGRSCERWAWFMVPRAYLDALRVVRDRLDSREILWAITGSLGFALQGLDFDPHDIDLQADREGAYTIGRALAEYEVTPVRFRQGERIRSHFGTA